MSNSEYNTKKDIEQLRSYTKTDIGRLCAEVRADIKKDMEALKHSLTLRLGAIMVGCVVSFGVWIILVNQ